MAIWISALPVADNPPTEWGPWVSGLAGGALGLITGLVAVSLYHAEAALVSSAACAGVFVLASRRIRTNRLALILAASVIASAGLASDFAQYVASG